MPVPLWLLGWRQGRDALATVGARGVGAQAGCLCQCAWGSGWWGGGEFGAGEDFAAAEDDWFVFEGVFEAEAEDIGFACGGGGGGACGLGGGLGAVEGVLEPAVIGVEFVEAAAESGDFGLERGDGAAGLFEGRFVRGEGVAVGGEGIEEGFGFLEFGEERVDAGLGIVDAFLHEIGVGAELAGFEFCGFEGFAGIGVVGGALAELVAFGADIAEDLFGAFEFGGGVVELGFEGTDAVFDAAAAGGFCGDFCGAFFFCEDGGFGFAGAFDEFGFCGGESGAEFFDLSGHGAWARGT